MAKGDIVKNVVAYLVGEIVDNPGEVSVDIVEEGDEEIVAEVRCAKPDMGRVIGRRGRVARAIRNLAQAAGEEEGLTASVEFVD